MPLANSTAVNVTSAYTSIGAGPFSVTVKSGGDNTTNLLLYAGASAPADDNASVEWKTAQVQFSYGGTSTLWAKSTRGTVTVVAVP